MEQRFTPEAWERSIDDIRNAYGGLMNADAVHRLQPLQQLTVKPYKLRLLLLRGRQCRRRRPKAAMSGADSVPGRSPRSCSPPYVRGSRRTPRRTYSAPIPLGAWSLCPLTVNRSTPSLRPGLAACPPPAPRRNGSAPGARGGARRRRSPEWGKSARSRYSPS